MIAIRTRLTRELLCAVILLLCAGAGVFYYELRDVATEQFDATLRARALAIEALADDADDDLRSETARTIMLAIQGHKAQHFIQMTDRHGTPIISSPSMNGHAALDFHEGSMSKPAFWNLTLPNGKDGRAISFSFTQGASRTNPQTSEHVLDLVVACNRHDLDDTLTSSLWIFVVLGAVLVVVTALLIPAVLRRGLRPLNKLGEEAAGINAESLATRFSPEKMPAELRPIAARLNELLGRLEESFARERRFSANLAHELRTPLAELHSMAECALKWPESRDPSIDAGTLEITCQMERSVTNLLALARGDKGLIVVNNEPIELAPFLVEIWHPLAARAIARHLKISFPFTPPTSQASMRCLADRALLRSIALNLCENAIDYTTEGGALSIDAQSVRNNVTIIFSNDTNDLSETDLPRLFEHFWRKDPARTGAVHSGLGLPLARTLAQEMGWTLTAKLARTNGREQIVFSLSGPLA